MLVWYTFSTVEYAVMYMDKKAPYDKPKTAILSGHTCGCCLSRVTAVYEIIRHGIV